MSEREGRATVVHNWFTLVGVPLLVAAAIGAAAQAFDMIGSQRDLAAQLRALQERQAETHRDMVERDTRVLRLIERLEDRMEARIARPPL